MPQCYGIIISLSSSRHATTQMWNVLGLVDHMQTTRLPLVVPLEIHLFWAFAPGEIGKDFEMRLTLTCDTTPFEPSEPLAFRSVTPYTHLKLHGVVLERAGEYRSYVEWRPT